MQMDKSDSPQIKLSMEEANSTVIIKGKEISGSDQTSRFNYLGV